ncbi:MAG: hypothetical protein Kow002_00240 [Anaerolineales bacterium]
MIQKVYLEIVSQPKNIARILTSVILGLAFYLFVHAYWLIDYFSVGSNRLLLSSLVTIILGIIGYFILISWLDIRLHTKKVSPKQYFGIVSWSFVVGAFLFFAGTSRWLSPDRYLTIFLPTQKLQVIVPEGLSSDISINWFRTSFGDVSFQELKGDGWARQGDKLILIESEKSRLTWSGKTGKEIQIVFQVSSPKKVMLIWNNNEEIVELLPGKNTYLHSFNIPFYASRELVLLLGMLHFALFSFLTIFEVWMNRDTWAQRVESLLSGIEKPNRFDAFFLLGVMLVAFALRFPNLGIQYPNVDEYYHLLAAKQINEGVPVQDVYQRSLLTVTLPTLLMYKLFGSELWAVRLPGVVISVLGLIPLYLLSLKVNRPTSIIASLLYATSPWFITFARLVREYAYFPFFFYWIIYGLVLFLERIPPDFTIKRNWKQIIRIDTFLLMIALILTVLYAIYDSKSTFKFILIAYIIFSLFVLSKIQFENKIIIFALMFLGCFLGLEYMKQNTDLLDKFIIVFYPEVVKYFFPNPPQQWYFNRLAIIPALGCVTAIVTSFIVRKKNPVPLVAVALFLGFLMVFIFIDYAGRPLFRVRFLQIVEQWYILVLSLGIYILVGLLYNVFGKKIGTVVTIIMGIAFINIQQVVLPITSTSEITSIAPKDLYYHNVGAVHKYLLENVTTQDILIGGVYNSYVSWIQSPEFRAKYDASSIEIKEQLFSIIDNNETGWIVMGQIDVGLLEYDLFSELDKKDIKYIGLFGDQHLWRWQNVK